ncbi:Histone deacetylase 8, partial [Fasciola gigantica]
FAQIDDGLKVENIVKIISDLPTVHFPSVQSRPHFSFVCHSSTDYVDALYQLQEWYANDPDPHLSADEEDLLDTYGLSYDCPGFRHVLDYALAAVRGSLAAAMALTRGDCRVVLNFAGGWHHAKRSEAAGFCYLNDIVLAIHHFLACSTDPSSRNRVLYVDFDLHHADGVEQAFWYSAHVVTFSVHHAAPGFFPGTGVSVESDTIGDEENRPQFAHGAGRGQFAAFNLPLGTYLLPESLNSRRSQISISYCSFCLE